MRQTPLTNISTMTKIRSGSNPIGTKHHLICYGPKGAVRITYAVRAVTGTDAHLPNGEPTIYLAFAGGREQSLNCPQVYVSMPLTMFSQESMPVTEGDMFWTDKGAKIDGE